MTHSTAGGVADSALASEESDDPSIRGLRGIISESTPRYASAATTQLSTVFAHPTLAATPAVVIGAGIGSARLSPESISSAGSELSSSQSSGSSMASLRALNTSAQHRARVAGMAERLLAAPAAANRFCLDKQDVRLLCQLGRSVFMSQPVLLELGTPVKVVGDIHGQFGDLLRILQLCGRPPATNYLFLGDYVDRGKQSLETFLLLLCFKILYPTHLFMLRGNHECASVTKVYGFYDECKRRLDVKAWRSLVDVFNVMPIAATIGGRIFCVHGGLSPYLNSLDDIRGIARPTDVPGSGLLSDLLWSDPERGIVDWAVNDRGVSYCFGPQVLAKFCQKFNFDLVARGHMVVEEGYEFFGSRKLVTIFSAPNYCGEFSNWGAVMSVSKDLLCSFELLKPAPAKKARKKRWY